MESAIKTIISFDLGSQVFAFDSLMVRNILEYSFVTNVPNSQEHVVGVINLHGNIVPVVDLRMIMGLEKQERTKDTTIIIVSPKDDINSQFGVVVDLVLEVFEVRLEDIEESAFQDGMGLIEHFEGAVNRNNQFIQVINLVSLLSQIE